MIIVVDTNEKRPYVLPKSVSRSLKTGDYSVDGFVDLIRIERKSFDDLFKCLTRDLARFRAQLKRLATFEYRGLLIDSSVDAILMGHVYCRLPGTVALRRLLGLVQLYDVPLHLVGGKGAAYVTHLLATMVRAEQ